MNFFLKPKILIGVIALLLVANIATFVGVVIVHNEKETTPEKQRNQFFKKLGLTEAQKKTFILKKTRFKAINAPLYSKYENIMIRLHNQACQAKPDTSLIRSYTDSLGILNAQIRRNWTSFAIEIRKDLSNEQKMRFDKITLEHIRCKMNK